VSVLYQSYVTLLVHKIAYIIYSLNYSQFWIVCLKVTKEYVWKYQCEIIQWFVECRWKIFGLSWFSQIDFRNVREGLIRTTKDAISLVKSTDEARRIILLINKTIHRFRKAIKNNIHKGNIFENSHKLEYTQSMMKYYRQKLRTQKQQLEKIGAVMVRNVGIEPRVVWNLTTLFY